MPVDQWAEEWLAAYVGRASSTQGTARSALPAHILPRFAARHLSAVTRFDVERMVNEIVASGRSPATAEKTLRTMSAVIGTRSRLTSSRAGWGRLTTSGPRRRVGR